ncbi:NPGR2-like protein [Tanacetum coccineum]|uniref:NPGR2-like protein n=1 Tax=Tanacetum coccineum TaxID=301880 RepID=A0ABQ5I3J3_9ASTR
MAGKLTGMNDTRIVYSLNLESAEQRKLDAALGYAKRLAKMEGGSSLKGWILFARILSGQKRFSEGETVINAALEQTGKWDQGELLKTKARLQVAQCQIKNALQTYTQILAVLQVQSKSFRSQKKSPEMETWHDLAMVYMKLSQWLDAEACLLKSETINYYSASRLHITGLLYEAKGLEKEAQNAYELALDLDSTYVPSLTRLTLRMGTNLIEAKIISGSSVSTICAIPRMVINLSGTKLPFKLNRRQFQFRFASV